MKYTLSPLSLLNLAKTKSLLSFGVKGYLAEIGWFNSFETKSSVDENGDPIPWVTYSFIDFIKERIHKDLKIFEFGSGNSTLFYAQRVKKVISVEHDRAWFEKVVAAKPENSEMIYCELETNGEYCRIPSTLNEKFDIIIIDGRDRINCCEQSLTALSSTGVVVLDNTERESYQKAISFMRENGFKHLAFTGISPGFFIKNSTSLFYRTDNCLNV